MKYINSLYRLFLLLSVAFCGLDIEAQTYGDQYSSTALEKVGASVQKVSSNGGGSYTSYVTDGNETTMWKNTGRDNNPYVIIDVGSNNYSNIKEIELFVKEVNRVARAVTISSSTSSSVNGSWTQVSSQSLNQSSTNNIIVLNKSLTGRYVMLAFTKGSEDQIGVSEVYFYAPGGDLTSTSIQHKPAKWYDLRKTMSINAADNFDEDESLSMNIAYDNQTEIQAAHTLIDTIYVHAGTSVTLTLPDYLNGTTNNKTYQRWYNYLTEGTFATGNTGSGDIVDYLTPGTAVGNNAANGTGYRFKNGYIGQPLSSACLYVMDFYVPKTGYQNWYLVACDVSGYTDFTEDFSSDSKNSSFANGGYWEPTLSHRFIYFIRVIEDETSWAAKQLNAGKPIEEKDITMPATRLPDYTNEMVALSMDARSYLTPTGGTTESSSDLTVSLDNNTAGITLNTTSLSGEDRVIFINYPNKNSDNTQSVNTLTDGSDPKATVNVYRSGTLVARYNLTFKEESRLLTQTQVSQENAKGNSAYEYRMPDYLKENYELLTELNFDFDDAVAEKYGLSQCYPFPLGWNSSTYGFYDGGVEVGDFTGPTGSHCPEWGYYGILNSYVECRDKDGSNWGWTSYTYNAPNDADPIRYNSKGNQSTYHLYADVSDRPGVIARLPFDRKLCPGTELFVTAWVKCARGDDSANNAAALFSIMGVKDRGVGTSSTKDYTPIYRYQTGQIPATYRNDGGLAGKIPGFEERNGTTGGNNDWLQVYFSFINTNSDDFDSYVLQIDNNSASTNGGDIYIDDIRVYVMSPNAKVTQLEAGCTNERTLTNIELDWEQLMSRLGHDETSTGEDAIDFCFIDKTKYNSYLAESGHETDYKGAVEASVIEIGNGDEGEGGYNGKYHTLYFKMPFTGNKEYTVGNKNLAADNVTDNKAYFYGRKDEAGVRSLSVDFYSALTPNRPYILLINTHVSSDGTLDASDFDYNINDACVIKTEFYVTAQTLIRVNGEVVDPSTDFCAGQVFNFSANLRVPTGVNDDGTAIYTEIKDGVYFDWFFGTEDEYTEVNETYGVSLLDALTAFRNVYTDNVDLTNVPAEGSGEFTKAMYDIISHYLEKPGEEGGQHAPLVLHKESLDITLLNSGLQLVVQPIRTLVPPGEITEDIWTAVCWSYIPLVLTTSGNAPQLHAGFNSVVYPADDFNPSLRIGLSQINETTADKPLRVDLRGAKFSSENSNATSLGMVTSVSSDVFKNIYLVGTDDPAYNNEEFFPADFSEYSLPVGYLTELYAEPYGEGSQYNDHMNIYFDTTTEQDNGFQFQPKEGYTYTFAVHFEEHGSDVSNACFGVFTVDMKVVPEILVWSGADATSNWNNDANWKRANATDLKNTDGTYTTNEANTTANGFVPMLFSNVIMPKDSKAELYMAGYADGGAWTSTSRPSYMELPTENIQYDLMAYEKEGALTTQRYRVNICNDIHFESGAQMLHAEQLIYNKAWTDVEITPGQWTAVSTPLQGVVAGDWYAPTETGRQETEYFKDIKFTDGGYNRLNPAVYQRSWSTGASIVENGGGTTPVSFATEWSSAYNDASVPYVAGGGFSVKGILNLGQQPSSTEKLLFRFPKADTEYTVSTAENKTVDRTTAGKLLVSNMVDRSNPLQYVHPDVVSATLTPSVDGKYLMVGNPFMAPLDVQAFVAANSDVLAQKYWIGSDLTPTAVTYDENSNTWSEGTSLIAPYSVFYVEALGNEAEDGTGTTYDANVTVKFTADMQQFETISTGAGSQATSLKITAEDAEGSSSAAVRYTASASNGFGMEDAQMISGLTGNADNAPKVYTVAGNTAVSVNQLKDAQRIPLGVTAADGSVVTLTFSGVAAVKDAAIYDAELQSETPLYEGYQLMVNGPSYGRYFLIGHGSGTTGITETGADGNVSVSSIVPRQVVVTSDTGLRSVSIWSAGGALLKKVTPEGNYTCTINGVNSGIVIVRTDTATGSQVNKIRVR